MNSLWTSRLLWISGSRIEAMAQLLEALRGELGEPLGLPGLSTRIRRLPTPYLQAVLHLMLDNHWTLRSYVELFPVLWRWAPIDLWLVGLKLYDDPFVPSIVEDAAVEVLVQSRLTGWLGCDSAETPNGGRAVLSDAMIVSFSSSTLRKKLISSLGSTGSSPMPGSWRSIVRREPDVFLERFLEWNFIVWTSDLEEFVLRWSNIDYQFPDYATTARRVIQESLLHLTDEQIRLLVELHAGRLNCSNPRAWLSALCNGVLRGEFDTLRMIEKQE